jgi:Putative adhesin
MQQNTDLNTEQTSVKGYPLNTDPREQAREGSGAYPVRTGWQPRPRKRRFWRTVLFCVIALAVAVGIAELTGGIPISSLHKTLTTRTFSLSGHGSLIVHEDSGSVHVHTGNTNQVIVRATEYAYGLSGDLNDLHVQYAQQGNTLTVTASENWSLMALSSRGIILDITVPARIDLAIYGSSGDANVSGIDGKINTNIASGNLSLDTVNGSLDLNTSSGDIMIINEHGPVNAHADSGDIRIDHAVGAMDLATSSGGIILNDAQISGQDHFHTDSGDIQFSGMLDLRGTYRMDTSSGNITLNLPANSSFHLATSTGSGSVYNAFSASAVGSTPRAPLTLSTDSGDIRVQKQ